MLEYNTTYLKALYRGYTDDTFSTLSEQPAWQGTQGPTIRSEVGDLVEIMFVNKLTKAYATMHSMGLAYSKSSEGSDYPNVTMPGQNDVLPTADAVPPVDAGLGPGECVVYKWVVPEGAGPNAGEPARVRSRHLSHPPCSPAKLTSIPDPQLPLLHRPVHRHTVRSYWARDCLRCGNDGVDHGSLSRNPPPLHDVR